MGKEYLDSKVVLEILERVGFKSESESYYKYCRYHVNYHFVDNLFMVYKSGVGIDIDLKKSDDLYEFCLQVFPKKTSEIDNIFNEFVN